MPGYLIVFFAFKHVCDDEKLNCFVMFDKCNFSGIFSYRERLQTKKKQ